MSRNIGTNACHHCPASTEMIRLDEGPERTFEELYGRPDPSYDGSQFKFAECRLCGARYTAWIHGTLGGHFWNPDRAVPFVDLSYRSTFNDEPGIEDLPVRSVRTLTLYRCTPLLPEGHVYWHLGKDEESDAARERMRERVRQTRDETLGEVYVGSG